MAYFGDALYRDLVPRPDGGDAICVVEGMSDFRDESVAWKDVVLV